MILSFLNPLNASLQDSITDSTAKGIPQNMTSRMPIILDGCVLVLYFGLLFTALFAARQVATHPAFFIIAILVFIFFFGAVAVIGIILESMASVTALQQAFASLPITSFLIRFWLLISLVSGLAIIAALFVKGEGNAS